MGNPRSTASAVLLLCALVLPSPAGAVSPYDPAVDWAEHLFGPANMNAFIGCGGLSVGISARGEITVLKYPSPSFHDQMSYFTVMRTLPRMGALPNMGSFLGLVHEGPGGPVVTWLRDAPWVHEQHYQGNGSDILITIHRNEELGFEVTTEDLVAPSTDLLIRHVTVDTHASGRVPEQARLILFENLDPCTEKLPYLPVLDWLLDIRNDYGLLFSARHQALLHFRPQEPALSWRSLIPLQAAPQEEVDRFVAELDRQAPAGAFFAIGADRAPASYQCGRQDLPAPIASWPQDAFQDARDGRLSLRPAAAGRASGALSWDLDLESGGDSLSIFFGAGESAEAALDVLDRARSRDFTDYMRTSERWWGERLKRARLPAAPDEELRRVCRRALVGLLSARDRRTGSLVASIAPQPPYALDWPRDGAFMSHALDRAGYADHVTGRNFWLAPLFHQDSGLVDMCFYSDGLPAGPLLYEIDNLSLALWSLWDHAGFLADPVERRDYLSAVYPAVRAGAGFLTRCRDPGTGLQCPTMEGDQPWLTQGPGGAASARIGLLAAREAGLEAGEDPEVLRAWKERSEELSRAIAAVFWDEDRQRFMDGPLGGYLIWPYPLLPLEDPRMQAQARATLRWCLENLHKKTHGGGYEPLALWMLAEQVDGLGTWARRQIEEALLILAREVRTPGTLHFGEAYVTADLDGDGDLEFEAHAAQPQIPIASMVYMAAMALYGPGSPEGGREPPTPPDVGGCGACVHVRGDGGGHAAILANLCPLVVLLLVWLALRRKC